ncbi:uncharacterized protein LOC142530996 [Primulina tabacum]|uniref:uncharacterized protein LOC142530996 n=1 Tax=Primulina tabacum TaxID=48773 RepID=UPI003F59CFC0
MILHMFSSMQPLKLHILELTKNIDELKLKMAKDKDTNDLLLAKDLKLGFVKELEIVEIYVNENKEKSFDKDLNSEDQSHFEYYAEESQDQVNTSATTSVQPHFFDSKIKLTTQRLI